MTLRTKLALGSGMLLAWLGGGLVLMGITRPGMALTLFAGPALVLVYAVRAKGWWGSPPTLAQGAAGVGVLASWAAALGVLFA